MRRRRGSCATVTHMAADEVSVRELRQNLSVYLRRVQDGATLAVTNRGQRVAVLSPVRGGSRLDRLVAERRVAPATRPWSEVTPAVAEADRGALTGALLALRDEDSRWSRSTRRH